MPELVWDKIDEKIYETGLDKGVLYLPDGSAVPWNGLTEVIEKFNGERSPVYYDGKKINDFVSLGEFAATIKAITYPDELIELEGLAPVRNGAWLGEQKPDLFGLCYRTKVGDPIQKDALGYKIHIIYNVIALPADTTYATQSDDPNLVEFEWDIQTIPDDIDGFRPSAHVVIDSRDYDPWLMEELESMLYGAEFAEASLIPMPELISYIKDWCRWRITDNGDGTYTAVTTHDAALNFSGTDDEVFHITGVYVVYEEDGETFTIGDTCDVTDIPTIEIIDNGDGTWTAITDFEGLFAIDGDTGYFNMFNANAVMVSPDEYRLSNTTED